MRLKDLFVKMLKEKGIQTITTDIKRILESDDPLQAMALHLALGKAVVCKGSKGKAFNLGSEGDTAYLGKCDNPILVKDELIARAVDFPYIVIDCSFFDKHTEKEKKKVILQIQQTLSVVRRYMWDERLVVTHLNCGVGVYYPSTAEFIRERDIKSVILLDPNGEEIFNGQKAECYIIGGIVDKVGNKKGWTTKIGEELRKSGIEFRSVKILLRGDIIGVPDRLNTIAEIVLRVVLDGEDVESAIRAVQSNLVAKWRLRKELPKRTIRIDINGKPFRVVRKSVFNEFDWLNIRLKDFYEVCSELGYLVMDDDKLDELLSNASYDEVKKRYIVSV